jgi:hypothetical protein
MGMILTASHRVLELACRKAYIRYRIQADQLDNLNNFIIIGPLFYYFMSISLQSPNHEQ